MQCIASSSKPRFQDHTIRGGGIDTRHETIYTPLIVDIKESYLRSLLDLKLPADLLAIKGPFPRELHLELISKPGPGASHLACHITG